jgi:O-antigen ligase
MINSNERLLPAIVTLTVLSTFLVGIIPSDHLFIQESTYLFIGSGILMIVIAVVSSKSSISKLSLNYLDLLLIAFVAYKAFRITGDFQHELNDSSLLIWVCSLPIYFAVKAHHSICTTANKQEVLIVGLASLTLFQSTLGLLQCIGLYPTNLGIFKIEGTFLNPGPYANFLALSLPLCFGTYLFSSLSKHIQWFLIAVISASLVALFFTQARTAWIVVVITFTHLLNKKFNLLDSAYTLLNTTIKRATALGAILVLAGVTTWLVITMKQDSTNGRWLIWRISINIIQEHPVLGTGTDTFISQYSNYQIKFFETTKPDFEIYKSAGKAFVAFNEYIQFGTELGIVGVALFLIIIAVAFFGARHPEKKTPTNLYATDDTVDACLLAVFITAFFSHPLQTTSTLLLFFIFLGMRSASLTRLVANITITKSISKFFNTILVLVGLFTLLYAIDFYFNCKAWKKISLSARTNAPVEMKKHLLNEAEKKYSALYKNLKIHYPFSYNYGTFLFENGNYVKSIAVLNGVVTKKVDPDLLMILGDAYNKLENYQQAEHSYKKASLLVPYLYLPKYKLFKLYLANNNTTLAFNVSMDIYTMQTKIYTPEVGRIKLEVKQYIESRTPMH